MADLGAYTRALVQELREAWKLDRPVWWIRITPNALQGTPTLVPLTPERIRANRVHVIVEGAGDTPSARADPRDEALAMEVLIHPADWVAVLKDHEAFLWLHVGEVTRFSGVEVRRSP